MNRTPRSLKNDGSQLIIEWDDDTTHQISWRLIREHCPCAVCIAEKAKPKPVELLPVIDVAVTQPLKPTLFEPMGNYAYSIEFSDGHTSGIYTLNFLYELGQYQAEVDN